jgi:hypothetical protein
VHARLIPDPPLFQIQIEPHARLRTGDLLAEGVFELLDLGEEPVVFVAHELDVLLFEQLELGFELGKVDVLGVCFLHHISYNPEQKEVGREGKEGMISSGSREEEGRERWVLGMLTFSISPL